MSDKNQQMGMTREELIELVRELRKPDQETLDKKEAERKKLEQDRKQMIQLAELELRTKRARQSNCNHKKEDGRTALAGQVHSDGKIHPICLHCHIELTPQDPPRELLAQGIG